MPRKARAAAIAGLAWLGYLLLTLGWTSCLHASALTAAKYAAVLLAGAAVAFSQPLRTRWRALATFTAGVAVAIALLGIADVMLGKEPLPGWIDPQHHSALKTRAASTFENPNLLGAFLALHLPLLLGLVLEAESAEGVVAMTCASVTVFTGLLLSFSRGGWIGAMAGLVAFCWSIRGHAAVKRLPIVAAAVALVAAPVALPVMERAATFKAGGELGIRQRVELYRGVLACIAARPLAGWGLNSFEAVYSRHRTVGGYYPLDAHDDPLHIALETGLPGLAIFAALVLALLRAAAPPGGKRVEPIAAGLFAGLAGFLVATLFVGSLRYLGLQLAFWLAAGLAIAAQPAEPIAAPVHRHARAWLSVAAAAAALYWIATWWSEPVFYKGQPSASRELELRRSLGFMPWRHELHYKLALVLVEQRRLQEALAELDAAERLDPLQTEYARWRAQVLAGLDRTQEALQEADRALAGDPLSEDYLLLRGRLLMRLGRFEDAAAALEKALATNPQYLAINRTVYPKVFAALRETYLKLGRARDARRIEQQAKELYPDWRP